MPRASGLPLAAAQSTIPQGDEHFQTGSAKFSGDDTIHSLCELNVELVHELLLHSA